MRRPLVASLLVFSLTLALLILPGHISPLVPSADAAASDLFISEYIEGSGFNKALEIYNGTGASVDLGAGQYRLELYTNGSATVSQSVNLTGTVAAGDVFVIANTAANATILAQADATNNAVLNHNGDDAFVLRKGGIGGPILDVIGQVGVDPGTRWGTPPTSTADNTLRRKSNICAGDTNPSDAFDPAPEWDGFPIDTSDGFGSHTALCVGPTPTPTPTATPTATPTPTPTPTPPPADHLVVSQIYGGGGNTNATYRNDYVELYNPTAAPITVSGWSVQYSSAGGSTFATGTTPLAGTVGPGQYYLVRLASGGANGMDLPQPNVEGAVNMSATAGKLALVTNTEAVSGAVATCPTDDPDLVDFVGWGSANCKEGAATAPAPAGATANTTAMLRKADGLQDTNQNGNDFFVGQPNPRRTATILDAAPSVTAVDTDTEPAEDAPTPRDASFNVFFSENVEVTGAWYDITCATTGAHTAVVYNGPRNYIVTPDTVFEPGEQCTFSVFASQVRDADLNDDQPNTDQMQADFSRVFTVAAGNPAPETQDVHLLFGNPSGAQADLTQPNNYLMEKPEFALSFNRDRGTPNWVSWHVSDDWTGFLRRQDTFRPDPAIPVEWNRVLNTDYSGSGFDRGHVVPSADRAEIGSTPLNQATFLMTNMIPQAPDNNQGTWNFMEQALRNEAEDNGKELYIVAGGAGTGGTGDNGFRETIANGKVAVPAVTWKVVLLLDKAAGDDTSRVSCSTRTIAVIVPNTNGTNPDWTTYLTTVDAVEQLTGYDFFSNLPDPVERCVEAGTNGNNPPLDTDEDGVPDSADNCDFNANPDQADFDQDGQGNACDADDDNDGVSDDDELAAGSDPLNPASTPEVCDGADNDLDGVVDEGFANTDGDNQANCVDADDDNDGVPDALDAFPLDPGETVDTDGDGIGNNADADDDGDNVADATDNCPLTPNPQQEDFDGNGVGDVCETDVPVRPADKEQCKNGGWMMWTPRFRNQGDCVQFVNTGK